MAGAFQSFSDELLVFLTRAGAFAAQNFRMGRHEAPQKLRVLVVHVANLVFSQKTGFGRGVRHISRS